MYSRDPTRTSFTGLLRATAAPALPPPANRRRCISPAPAAAAAFLAAALARLARWIASAAAALSRAARSF